MKGTGETNPPAPKLEELEMDSEHKAGKLSGSGKPHGGGSSNMLDRLQMFKLMLYVDSNRDYIAKSRLTIEELSKEASDKLGFAVTKANLTGAMESHGVEKVKTTRQPGSGGGAYLASVKEQVAKLQETVDFLIARLTKLENALGISEETPE